MSATQILTIILSVLIVMAIGVAAIPLSLGILLNNNNSIKLANKNTGIEQKVSHKVGVRDHDVGTGGSRDNNNNNNIESINKILNNKLKVSREFSGGRSGVVSNRRFNIAIVKPTFTAAAYSNSFYKFYFLFMYTSSGKNVTTHLNLLSSKIPKQLAPLSSSAFTMFFLSHHLKKLLPQSNIDILTDADVDGSSGPTDIFVKNGLDNKYDVLILGHQE